MSMVHYIPEVRAGTISEEIGSSKNIEAIGQYQSLLEGCNMKKIEKIPMAGFTDPGRQGLINQEEVIVNGEIDYSILVRKVDELGERLFKESRLLERI